MSYGNTFLMRYYQLSYLISACILTISPFPSAKADSGDLGKSNQSNLFDTWYNAMMAKGLIMYKSIQIFLMVTMSFIFAIRSKKKSLPSIFIGVHDACFANGLDLIALTE